MPTLRGNRSSEDAGGRSGDTGRRGTPEAVALPAPAPAHATAYAAGGAGCDGAPVSGARPASQSAAAGVRDVVSGALSADEAARMRSEIARASALALERLSPAVRASMRKAELHEMVRAAVTEQVVASKVLAINNELARRREIVTPASNHECAAARELLRSHDAAHELETKGFAALAGALRRQDATALASDMSRLTASGAMAPTVQKKLKTRHDLITWLDEHECARSGYSALSAAVVLLKGVAAEMHRAGTLGPLACPQRAMLACYPAGGAAYVSHRDCTVEEGVPSNRRMLTCCLYANEGWDDERDGGCLRLHRCNGVPGSAHVDVVPEAGTLVLFKSREVLHEVLPTGPHRQRLALTLWIFDARACHGRG